MSKIKVTDVILRDAHQSLIATRMRTEDMLPICDTAKNIPTDGVMLTANFLKIKYLNRITSYNVCYTKLLRSAWRTCAQSMANVGGCSAICTVRPPFSVTAGS